MSNLKFSTTYSEIKPGGHYIYLHRRMTDNSIFYVGKGKGKRAWDKCRSYNPHWLNTAKKHGVIVDIYKDNISEVCARTLEKILIHSIGIESLTNLTSGGCGGLSGYKWTSEQLDAKSGKNHFNYGRTTPDDVKASISKSLSGENNPRYGITVTHDEKARMVEWHKNNTHPMLNKNHSKESRLKMSIARKGKPKTDTFKEKMNKAVITKCGIAFKSITDATVWIKENVNPRANSGAISRCANKVKSYDSAYGYVWRYIDHNYYLK